jgi:hypothetical protein
VAGPSPSVGLVGLAGLIPIVALVALSPADRALVAISLGAIAGAGIAALLAYLVGAEREPRGFGAWDAAGMLALIGFGAGMIAQPENVLKFFGLS